MTNTDFFFFKTQKLTEPADGIFFFGGSGFEELCKNIVKEFENHLSVFDKEIILQHLCTRVYYAAIKSNIGKKKKKKK